jgi:primosomal replication protein N
LEANQLTLTGIVAELETLRYTPAGVPLLGCLIRHESQQIEAGSTRRVSLDIAAVVMGELAQHSALSLGKQISVAGFLARKSQKSNHIVLHICSVTAV